MSETIVVPDNGNNMNNAFPYWMMSNGWGNGFGGGFFGNGFGNGFSF